MIVQVAFGDSKNSYRSLTSATEVSLILLSLKCLNRAQRFTPTTTHGLQKRTGGVFDWSVIASNEKIR